LSPLCVFPSFCVFSLFPRLPSCSASIVLRNIFRFKRLLPPDDSFTFTTFISSSNKLNLFFLSRFYKRKSHSVFTNIIVPFLFIVLIKFANFIC